MRVVELQERFGLENITLATRPEPTAGPGQVVLRMLAASPNYRDLLMVQGQYNPKQPLPLIPGSDGVGQVVSVGPGVERVQVGDRVAPIFAQNWICGRPTTETLRSTLGSQGSGGAPADLVRGTGQAQRVSLARERAGAPERNGKSVLAAG